jgi:hypothetical protein
MHFLTMCFGDETSCPEAYGHNNRSHAKKEVHFRDVEMA